MTKRKDESEKPGIEEIDAEQLDDIAGAGTRRELTAEEEKRLKEQHALGPEGTDIGSGGITSSKK